MGIRVLVLGSYGQLGHTLGQHAKPALLDTLDAYVGVDRDTLDMTDPDQLISTLKDVRPDVIINAAAYTAVEQAEKDAHAAFAVNAHAVGVLAEQAKKQGAVLVHYSTDYVFDGTATRPYVETDAVNPVSVYGQSKLQGEQFLEEVGGHWVNFRTSWVFAQRGGNFCKTILKAASERDELKVVDDQRGAPTPANFLAELGLQVAGVVAMSRYKQLGKLAPSFLPDHPSEVPSGETFHATAAGETTWYDYACFAIEQAHQQGLLTRVPTVLRAKTPDMNFKAARPAYSVLDNTKLKSVFRVNQPDWQKAVRNLVVNLGPDFQ
ncbi:dTDP-4-dehydrorhamnose reductase [Limnobacter humi]|uniref:dTDP-4-dehydrorhamnose reductase n=1 Tax=Limnobacter humi TaxID=1778671 RepID=A0ABT1WKI1_9BURK|nr:dTDP-4-dehydrorhamnose reductase [Limnobacter humi]